eukprot:361274-Chlamydomonas_euryale.AAC.1
MSRMTGLESDIPLATSHARAAATCTPQAWGGVQGRWGAGFALPSGGAKGGGRMTGFASAIALATSHAHATATCTAPAWLTITCHSCCKTKQAGWLLAAAGRFATCPQLDHALAMHAKLDHALALHAALRHLRHACKAWSCPGHACNA